MKNSVGEGGDTDIHDTLKEYCIRVIRFVSNSALDPHLYFEKKLIGDVTVAETREELLNILTGLLEWIEETFSDASGLSGVDQALNRDGFPSLSLLLAPETRMTGLVLARGRILSPDEYRLVEKFSGNMSMPAADRNIADRLLTDYEPA